MEDSYKYHQLIYIIILKKKIKKVYLYCIQMPKIKICSVKPKKKNQIYLKRLNLM